MSRFGLALVAVLSVLELSCSAPAVSCKQAADCTDTTKPICAVSLGACVECNDDAQCANGFVCDQTGTCSPGCSSVHGRCALGQYCKPGADCVECLNDTQCAAGNVCTNNACVPGCSKHNGCADGKVCDLSGGASTGTCVGCVDSSTCGAGVCDPKTKTCVGCTANADCKDPSKPACDTSTNTCVGCLPGADHCPSGQYCRNDQTCERGCKVGADCPSGKCLPSHSCDMCTGDNQCAAGNICQNGTCTAACSDTNKCGSGRDCCDGRCIDATTDNKNCGACGKTCSGNATCCNSACKTFDTVDDCGSCGKACGAGGGCCNNTCIALNTQQNCGACGHTCTANEFCDGTTCHPVTFPEFCANLNVYAIHDDVRTADGGVTLDNGATDVLASTIHQYCSPDTVIHVGSQNNPAWVDQTTGALLLGGGATVVTAGGPFPNRVTKWLERTNKATKVYFATNSPTADTFYFKKRSDDSVLVTRAQAWCSAHQDVFVVELAADSSTLALLTYGLCSPGNGTATAAWYWANVMLPNRATYTDSWYLYEWVDTNGNGIADDPTVDTYTKLASGK